MEHFSIKCILIVKFYEKSFNFIKSFFFFRFVKSRIRFFLLRRILGISVVNDHEEIFPLLSSKTVFQGTMWVIKNLGYIMPKRKK